MTLALINDTETSGSNSIINGIHQYRQYMNAITLGGSCRERDEFRRTWVYNKQVR